MADVQGIDVSKWQGEIIWASVKASGIGFAIIKAGGSDAGFYTDPKFEKNYKEAKSVGMPIGAYYFVGSKCISYEDGVADAERFAKILSGKTFEYPVYIDLESTSMADKAGATQAVIGFCKTMEDSGYYCGVYASDIYGFQDRLDLQQLTGIDKWVARYGSEPAYVTDYQIWQYSEKGKISGISGNVDLDKAVVDYPSIMKEKGLNGFNSSTAMQTDDPTADTVDWKAEYNKLLSKINNIKAILDE